MITRADDTAMPFLLPRGEDDFSTGLTKREIFSKDAPDTVPYWFVHNSSDKPVEPKSPYTLTAKQSEIIAGCIKDPCWSLPQDLSFFEKLMNDYNNSLSEWERKDAEERYFQWRTYYADKLIEQLNKIEKK